MAAVSPNQSGDPSVRTAFQQGVADGCREHLPGAVGIVAKGVPICAIAGYAHFALGVGIPQTALGTLIAAASGGAAGLVQRRIGAGDKSSEPSDSPPSDEPSDSPPSDEPSDSPPSDETSDYVPSSELGDPAPKTSLLG